MIKAKWLACIMVLVVMVVFAMPVKVIAGAVSIKEYFEAEGGGPTSCIGETIYISGINHSVVKYSVDSQDCAHIISHTNWQNVTAEGEDTGNIYQLQWSEHYSERLCGGYPYVVTVAGVATLTSPGGDVPNHIVPFNYHMTINANGELTVEFLNIRHICE